MSEYQYYEFQAVDRPLNKEQMAELRALTTRATITPTRLVNEYHWGDFKGNPLVLMERYFDAFVYVANWGTHRFMLRLPARLLDPETAGLYAGDAALSAQTRGDFLILDVSSRDEEGADWDEGEVAANWLSALLPLRADLAGGDLRALYLAWLAGVWAELLDDEEIEPPIPPRLGSLSPSLKALADFLRIDDDLLAVAAAKSAGPPAALAPAELERWIEDLSVRDKNAWLLRLATADQGHVRAEFLRGYREAQAPTSNTVVGGRTVVDLLAAAEERAEARRCRADKRAAAERARREREQAVRLLKDLHDLGVHRQQAGAFAARLGPLRERYAKRLSFLERLGRAGLRA